LINAGENIFSFFSDYEMLPGSIETSVGYSNYRDFNSLEFKKKHLLPVSTISLKNRRQFAGIFVGISFKKNY